MHNFFKISFLLLGISTSSSMAQQLKLVQGIAFTQFHYKDYKGQNIQGFRSSSGLFASIAFHKASLVDSLKYRTERPTLASLINYDIGLQYTQLNAVGDIQSNPVSYQTDYVGLHGKLGFRVPLPWKFSLNFQAIANVSKIVQGNQLLMNRYIDLTEDLQFAQIKIMAGLGAEFEKRFSDKLAGFVAYHHIQTLNSNPVGQSALNFSTAMFSLGIRLLN